MKRSARVVLCLSALLLSSMAALGATTKSVKFDSRKAGEEKSIGHWGIDATWINMYNARASLKNAGEQIDFIRIGFYLHEPYADDGSLSSGQIKMLDKALEFVNVVDQEMPIMLSPNNEKGIVDWYKKSDGSARIDRWYNVMLKSKEYVESKGHPVVSLEVFNEPDWKKWNMGHEDDLDELMKMCRDWDVMRVGASTLGTQSAEAWYDEIDRNIEAGSTHTLSGTMDQYIDFMDTVKGDRKQFMNPEVHALVEVIVGAEEGLDSACWWDQINVGRARFMQACQGKRLAYVAVEQNWSAACVYRGPDDVLYGFAGTNERDNGKETVYKFVCTSEDVTYCLNGETDQGIFRKKGQSFEVQAKVKGEGKTSITQWFTIIPGASSSK